MLATGDERCRIRVGRPRKKKPIKLLGTASDVSSTQAAQGDCNISHSFIFHFFTFGEVTGQQDPSFHCTESNTLIHGGNRTTCLNPVCRCRCYLATTCHTDPRVRVYPAKATFCLRSQPFHLNACRNADRDSNYF